jgi:hypothetical protein
MVWKRPADGGGQDDRDPDESAHQDNESAEPFDQWADGGARVLDRTGHGHPPEATPLTSVADSVTLIWRLPTPMMPSSWVGCR